MICLELNWFVYDPSWMLQLSEFVWTLRSSVWVVFNNFLLIAENGCKFSSNYHRIFFDVSLYSLLTHLYRRYFFSKNMGWLLVSVAIIQLTYWLWHIYICHNALATINFAIITHTIITFDINYTFNKLWIEFFRRRLGLVRKF